MSVCKIFHFTEISGTLFVLSLLMLTAVQTLSNVDHVTFLGFAYFLLSLSFVFYHYIFRTISIGNSLSLTKDGQLLYVNVTLNVIWYMRRPWNLFSHGFLLFKSQIFRRINRECDVFSSGRRRYVVMLLCCFHHIVIRMFGRVTRFSFLSLFLSFYLIGRFWQFTHLSTIWEP